MPCAVNALSRLLRDLSTTDEVPSLCFAGHVFSHAGFRKQATHKPKIVFEAA